MPTRREFLAGALATIAVACTGGKSDVGPTPPPGPVTIDDLQKGVPQLSVLGLGPGALGGDTKDPLQTGTPLVAFDLSSSQQLIGGGTPQVYVAKEPSEPAAGPFRAVWTEFTGYEKTGDHSPKSNIPGIYFAQIKIPSAGLWTIAVVGPDGRDKGVGVTHAYVSDTVANAVGSEATAVRTPVATSEHGLREICTRQPPCDLHSISLDDALKNGKPTVAVFTTPLLCESRLCGPVTDEALLVSRALGKQANFVHVEEFLPGSDLKPPLPSLENQSPGFKAWKLHTEPWTFVIDGKGVIRQRVEGSITAPVIDAALKPYL